jgi:hypothetical protein
MTTISRIGTASQLRYDSHPEDCLIKTAHIWQPSGGLAQQGAQNHLYRNVKLL